jgi:hypothetical protein
MAVLLLGHLGPPNSLVAPCPRRPARRHTLSTQVSSGVSLAFRHDSHLAQRRRQATAVDDLRASLGDGRSSRRQRSASADRRHLQPALQDQSSGCRLPDRGSRIDQRYLPQPAQGRAADSARAGRRDRRRSLDAAGRARRGRCCGSGCCGGCDGRATAGSSARASATGNAGTAGSSARASATGNAGAAGNARATRNAGTPRTTAGHAGAAGNAGASGNAGATRTAAGHAGATGDARSSGTARSSGDAGSTWTAGTAWDAGTTGTSRPTRPARGPGHAAAAPARPTAESRWRSAEDAGESDDATHDGRWRRAAFDRRSRHDDAAGARWRSAQAGRSRARGSASPR